MKDKSDVRLAKKGDKAAFIRLIKDRQHSLYRIAKAILIDEEDCTDAIQQAIIKGYYTIYRRNKLQAFDIGLIRILVTQCYDLLKKRKIDGEMIEPLPQTQTIFLLFHEEQLSIQEISEILDVEGGYVRNKLENFKEWKHRTSAESMETTHYINEEIDRTLDALPDLWQQGRIASKPVLKYWLTGFVCAGFFIVLMFYFQFNKPAQTTMSISNNPDMDVSNYQEVPIEPHDIFGLILDSFNGQISPDKIENIAIETAIKQNDRWIVLAKFGGAFPNYALVEVKKEKNTYGKHLLKIVNLDVSGISHWYSVEDGIGFGSGRKFVESIQIQTKEKQFTCELDNGYFIYVSDEKPEKVVFYRGKHQVVRSMETFNFDDAYPLIAKREGELALFVVAEEHFVKPNVLEEKGINSVTTINSTSSLENANKQYAFLELDKAPAYVVFNDKEMIFKTYNKDKLFKFLSSK